MKVYRHITSFVTRVWTVALLTLAFLFGIGPVAILFKLTGGKFLRGSEKTSSWDVPTGSNKAERMY